MGFLSSIMAPIGRPQAPPPARDIRGPFGGLFNSVRRPLIGEVIPKNALPPVVGGPALPPVDPRIIPQRPPSIGGIGGINQPLQPVLQQPQPPQTGGIPVTGGGPLGSGILPIADLPASPAPPPTNIGIQIPDVPRGGGFLKRVARNVKQQIRNVNQQGGPQSGTMLPIMPPSMPQLPQGPQPLEKMPLPPKRDDFMSIGGPGGGLSDLRQAINPDTRQAINPKIGEPVTPVLGAGEVRAPTDMGVIPGSVIQDPIGEPTMTPAPTTPTGPTDMGVTPTGIQNPPGTVDPVLQDQRTAELITDPLVRALYFGTADQPGFYNQLQQAGANLIGSDVPLQQTAGLTPLELLARQQAVAGIGGFEPFLQQNRELVNQAIEQSRRAEGLQDPYYTQAEQIYQDTMGAYDPGMTQQFYNPFEDAVVQQTVSDVLEAGEQQDIAARAREIGAGAFGGSRARLGAMERREALGEGLAQALGKIRQQGFSEAQRTGLSEFARQQDAKRTGAQGLIGIGRGRGSAASDLATQLAGFGGQMTGIGQTQEQLRAGQRGELSGFGATGRGIAETGLSRLFQQQMDQQMRPLGVISQIGSLLPGYKQASTQIDSTYGMPKDPTAEGLGAAFSAYAAVAPKGG